jgi:glycosyltransferase involved in cell wall biosynthesis
MAALAHGVPIVTTAATGGDLGAMPPEIQDGQNMLLVPPDDPGALVAALQRLTGSLDLRSRLCQGARELSRLFDWGLIAARHREVYRGLA